MRRIARTVLCVLALAGVCFLLWGIVGSQAFQTCVSEGQQQEAYKTFPKSIAEIAHMLALKVGLYRDCGGEFIHKNGEAITALFTVILAISTILLWSTTRSLAEAGTRQLRLLETDQRSWIQIVEIKSLPNQPRIDGMEVLFDLDIIIKNVGHSPAFVLGVYAELASIDDGRSLESKMQNIREAAEASLNDPGEARAWTVVPNDTLAYLKQKLVLDVGADELAKEQVEYRPTILGCVVYRSFHNKDHLHHTPFVANISFDDEGSTLRRYEQGPIKVVDGRVRGEMKIKNLGIPGIAD